MLNHPDSTDSQGAWIFNINSRYHRSYKHFIGRQEQPQRVELGTDVINNAFTQDIALPSVFNSRWSFTVDVLVLYNTRSLLYEHGGKERHTTSSFGIGDVRFTAYS